MENNSTRPVGMSKPGIQAKGIAQSNSTIRDIQEARGDERCYRTERRLLCKDYCCGWRTECKPPVAEQ